MVTKMEIEFQEKANNIIDISGLPEKVVQNLISHNLKIASAESCTGGMFAANITDVSGASAIFDRGIVTYSNQAKVEELGVREDTLIKFGAVSKETAIEMAQGIKRVAVSDIGISVTGIAGPSGGTESKPVGLVYMCVAFEGRLVCRELRLKGNRAENRKNSVLNMFQMLNEIVC